MQSYNCHACPYNARYGVSHAKPDNYTNFNAHGKIRPLRL